MVLSEQNARKYTYASGRFTGPDLQKLCIVLKNAVAVPVHGESTPYIVPSVPDVVLTHLQDGVLHSMELLQKVRFIDSFLNCFIISRCFDLNAFLITIISQEALNGPDNLRTMIVLIFLQLLSFSKLACEAPIYGKIPTKHISQIRGVSVRTWTSQLRLAVDI